MLHDYQSIDALVRNVLGTTGFLSRVLSRKFGLLLLFVASAVLVSKLIFN
jgi:hypothetical protein